MLASLSILFGVGAMLLACAIHPLVGYPISLALFARRRIEREEHWDERPNVAICLSAYNEEAVIAEKIRSLIAAAERYGPATLHVYTDGCSDRTVELLEPFADQIDLVVSTERRGKTHGMNLLMERSASTLVMFSDANVVARESIIEQLANPFRDPNVGCTTARLLYTNRGESATSLAGSIYWAIEEAIKQIESETIGMIGVDGASFMVRRALYRRPPENLIDDLYVTLNILATGAAVVRVPKAVIYERSAVKVDEEYRRKVRIAAQAIAVHRHLWVAIRKLPAWTVYGYVSHRLMKWMIPFFLAGAALAFTAGFTVLWGWPALAVIAAAAAITAIGGMNDVPVLALLYTSALSLFGVARGVVQGASFGNGVYDMGACRIRSIAAADLNVLIAQCDHLVQPVRVFSLLAVPGT